MIGAGALPGEEEEEEEESEARSDAAVTAASKVTIMGRVLLLPVPVAPEGGALPLAA